MGVREGLSFSDYGNDDKTPYEVKPPEMLRPMQEDDYPIQARDLFGNGLHETDVPDDAPLRWIGPNGEFIYTYDYHAEWAKKYLKDRMVDVSEYSNKIYEHMFRRGFIRVNIHIPYMYIEYTHNPTNLQWRNIKNYVIENNLKLMDEITGKEIDLTESLTEGTLPFNAWYWLDPKGKFISIESSPKKFGNRYVETPDVYEWAQKYLATKGIESDDNDAFDKMYALGFVMVFVSGGVINYEYNPSKPPNKEQITMLLNASIKSKYDLYDKTKHETIRDFDTNKTYLKEDKRNKRVFILEHMMPQDTDTFKSHLAQLFEYLQKELQLKSTPKVKLLSDQKNADKVLGKTAYYDSEKMTICLYETNRHQKDILRSFAHEVIHHWQHENERLKTSSTGGKKGESPQTQDPQYAQKDPWMRQMEKQAYLLGNILFRDWEDKKKSKDRQSSKKGI